jgi:hypothetical protein
MAGLAQNLYLGVNIGTATLTPCTRAGDGTLTVGTSFSLLLVIENINMKRSFELEKASITASPFMNHVKTETGTDYELTGYILKNDAAGAVNGMSETYDNFDYVKLVHNRAGRVFTYYGLWENYEETMSGKNAVKFSASLKMIDIGSPNPLLS